MIQLKQIVAGALNGGMIRVALGTATATSATQIPAGAIVYDTRLDVDVPYTAGTTIEMGTAATPNLFMLTSDNVPTAIALSQNILDVAIGASPVNLVVTIVGALVGSGFAFVLYSIPTN